MRPTPRSSMSAAIAIALAASTTFTPTTAQAAPDGSNIVINEAYGGAGEFIALHRFDFVELFNPTDASIDITGWQLQAGEGETVSLSGEVPARGHFLILGLGGTGKPQRPLPDADADGLFDLQTEGDVVALSDATGTEVDRVDWRGAQPPTTNYNSVQRKVEGVDTDDDAADFFVSRATPANASAAGLSPKLGGPKPYPEVLPIAQIQGTGDTSPLEGQRVTTEGVVTAGHWIKTKKNIFLQTAGSGGEKHPGDASDGIAVLMGSGDFVEPGMSLRISGLVQEVAGQTTLVATSMTQLEQPLEPPVAVPLDTLPAGDAAREPYEGMLIRPGTHTVTGTDNLHTIGELGLAPGNAPHRAPTDIAAPGAAADQLAAQQQAELVHLTNGSDSDYTEAYRYASLPFVERDRKVGAIRVGDTIEFIDNVVVDQRDGRWRLQPVRDFSGNSKLEDVPVTWEDSRPGVYDVPSKMTGDYSVGFFSVMNYFTTLGQDEPGCQAAKDYEGKPVTAKDCKVRGAYSQDALNNQQAKLVTAINQLDADVIGLAEIENTATVTGNAADRDNAVAALVEALNAKVGEEKWAYVASPDTAAANEDVTRVALIYNKAKVNPVGESQVLNDDAFVPTGRHPQAQEFAPAGGGQHFVAVVNHFASPEDGGANARTSQSRALLDQLSKQQGWADLPTFLVGNFNSYSKDDALTTLEAGGYQLVAGEGEDLSTYQRDNTLGATDHVLVNDAAQALVRDAAVWKINSVESAAFEYSRHKFASENYLGEGDDPLYGYGNPFRSSDHDPIKVGFDAGAAAATTAPTSTTPTSQAPSTTTPAPTTATTTTSPTPVVSAIVDMIGAILRGLGSFIFPTPRP